MFFDLQFGQNLHSSLVLGAQRRAQHAHGELIKVIPAKAHLLVGLGRFGSSPFYNSSEKVSASAFQ
jgi:hypothetical protein